MKEKFAPCLEKNCSYCCDPVKVNSSFPEDKIPQDKNEEPLWKQEKGTLVSKECPDGVKIKIYNCKEFNKETGLCNNYYERPEICRNTSCLDKKSKLSINEQHKKTIEEKFILIK